MYYTYGLIGSFVPFVWCIVLGAILAPTDAVVIENLLNKIALPPRVRTAIVGESLFNDGAGVVLFLVALGVTEGDTYVFGHGIVAVALLREIAGGALLGFVGGWLAAMLLRRISDGGLQLADFAGAGDRHLPHRQPDRIVRPDRRCLRRVDARFAVAALWHEG